MEGLRRRDLIGAALGTSALAATSKPVAGRLPFDGGERQLVALPEKRPLLQLTQRPPQLETPFDVFGESLRTPNDAFFVRYHLAGAPPRGLDAKTHRVAVGGAVRQPLTLSLASLKRDYPTRRIVAVNECSGNGRGFSNPRVPGGQLGNGMMGNAEWRGVPLSAVLAAAGVRPEAIAVEFNGADRPVSPGIPDYVKSLPLDVAMRPETLLAYEMNGKPLPLLNGYPLRLVVPGYYGTYWVKHVTDIRILATESESFWMRRAYRNPDNACACTPAGQPASSTRPISRLNVRSFITGLNGGRRIAADRPLIVRGIAFDGGSGIAAVTISADAGQTWTEAQLGRDAGAFAFRPWDSRLRLPRGRHVLLARATSRSGETQPLEAQWNPSGYMRNVVERVEVEAL